MVQVKDAAAMREGIDAHVVGKELRIGAAVVCALHGIEARLAVETPRVLENLGDSRAANIRIFKLNGGVGEQNTRGPLFDRPARFVPVAAGSDDFADASLLPNFSFRRGLWLRRDSGQGQELLELSLFIGIEGRRASQQAAFVDSRRARRLAKSGIEYGVGFEHQPLRLPDGGIDNGALKQLPSVANKEPA